MLLLLLLLLKLLFHKFTKHLPREGFRKWSEVFQDPHPSSDSADDCSHWQKDAHEKSQPPSIDQADDQSSYKCSHPTYHHADLVANTNLVLRHISGVEVVG